jgi:Dolichyl-phosphate-mannose-protein mannosyltransferase
VLTGLVALSTIVRFWAGTGIAGLWIMPDEAIYASIGENLWRHAELSIFGGGTALYSLVYPALAGLPLVVLGLDHGYTALKAVQALVMSLTAVPVYLWGRRLMSRGWALTAAALTLALPGLLYSGLVMTEVAFLPILVLAAWAMARALEEPVLGRQVVLVLAIAVAAATRLQAMVLVPVLVTALVVKAWFDRDRHVVRRFVPTLAGLGGLALLWAAYRLGSGGSPAALLGSYEAAGEVSYDPVDVARFVFYHLGDTLLIVGIVPACALALLVLDAVAGRERSAPARAFLAVAVSAVAWIVLEVGAFASEHVHRLAERDLLPLAPLLFLALGLWLDRGAPRPRIATWAVALLAIATIVALPMKRFSQAEALPDAFMIAPIFRIIETRPEFDPAPLVVGVALVLLAGFALLPRRALVAVPAAIFALLAFTSVIASREVAQRATYDDQFLLGGQRDWIERKLGPNADVAYLYTNELYWNGVYQLRFWNPNIRRVYYLYPEAVPGPIPQEPVTIAADGLLERAGGRFARERYVVAPADTKFIGTDVAELQQYGISQAGLILWRLKDGMQLSYTVSGVRPDGDIHEPVRVVAHRCAGGYFRVTLIAKLSRRVELRLNGKPYRTIGFNDPGQTFSEDIPATPDPRFRSCTLEIRPDSLLGSTAIEFLRP